MVYVQVHRMSTCTCNYVHASTCTYNGICTQVHRMSTCNYVYASTCTYNGICTQVHRMSTCTCNYVHKYMYI